MKRRVKPFNELSRWQQNRRLRQNIDELAIFENYVVEEESNIDIAIPISNKQIIENNEMENLCIQSLSQCTDISDILQYSDSNQSNVDVQEEINLIENIVDNNYEAINTTNFVEHNKTFASELQFWAITNNISNDALSKLLKLYKKYHDNEEIPNDARVFLNTPKKCIIKTCGDGEFIYLGLQKVLLKHLERNTSHFINNLIIIDINIDGLPISKSTNRQLWPIQGRFINVDKPFIIGIYHGMSKPSSVEEFLNEFVDEYCVLRDEGFEWDSKRYFVQIRAVICDSPARSFVKCIKYSTGYNGCERCTVRGEYEDKVIFLDCNCERRTDHSFKNKLDPYHHTGISLFERLGIEMVSAFPLDYMHLVLLGVTKRLMLLWTKGVKECRISSRNYKILNERLCLNKNVPFEISRKPRSDFNEFHRWKATEFRFSLLYLAPFILYDILPHNYIQHFSALHCAIRILSDPLNCVRNKEYASKLLLWFVQNVKSLYGTKNCVYNIHNLIHLADDVDTFRAPLDNFSCFPFENEMKTTKKYLRKHDKPLSQIFKRISEETSLSNKTVEKIIYPILKYKSKTKLTIPFCHDSSYEELVFEKFNLCTTTPNNICYLKDGSIYNIKYIATFNSNIFCIGYKVIVSDVPFYPLESNKLDVHLIKNENKILERFTVDQIKRKGIKITLQNSAFILPFLHF